MTNTIYHGGVQLQRNLILEKRIKAECKYYNSQRHPSERSTFAQYCECYYSYVVVKNNKVYGS
jgi:hypothetical protein